MNLLECCHICCCPVSGSKRLIMFENNVSPTLNPILNLKSINRSKQEIKAHSLKHPYP